MPEPRIVDRGDGPKIEGTRITVYTVFEDLRNGHGREEIALSYGLSSRQVQAAIDYIGANEAAVIAEYEKIMERINRGNPPHIEAILQENHQKLLAPRRIAGSQAPVGRTMLRVMSDNDVRGHLDYLVMLCRATLWHELWTELQVDVFTFNDLGLAENASDATVWRLFNGAAPF